MSKNITFSSIALIFAGFFFVINDSIINYLAPLNIKFYHFIFYGIPAFISVPIYLLISGKFKSKMKASSYFIPLFRGLLFVPMPFIVFISLKNISLPEFTTINMASPIFAGVFSIFFLKEKFNFYILISLFLGLVGVIFVIQPGFEKFNFYFLVALSGAFLMTFSGVLVNKYDQITSSVGFFVYGGLFTHLFSIIFFIYDPLKISPYIFFLITLASIVINLAILLSVLAFKYSQKFYASIFCLVYLNIIWASLIGFVIFDEYLNTFALLGALLIILSGIISFLGQIKQIHEQ